MAIHVVLALGAGVMFWRLLPHGGWNHVELLLALLCLGVLSVGAGELLGSPAQFDATLVVGLVALVLCGPLPALAIEVAVEVGATVLIASYTPRKYMVLGNATSFAWDIVAAWAVLAAFGSPSPAVAAFAFLLAGGAKVLVNFFVTRGIVGTLGQGFALSNLVHHELIPTIPAIVAMLFLGAATVGLVPSLGILALLAFAVIVGVPQAAATMLVRARSVAELEPLEATQLYVRALADRMGLDSRMRRVVCGAAQLLDADRADCHVDKARAFEDAIGDEHDVIVAALYAGERWDGTGRPGQLKANAIPQISRLLAVAQAWSELTAKGTPQLPHSQALARLSQQVGFALDPEIVAAAEAVVGSERRLDPSPTFQPRLHRVPGPRPLRAALPRLLAQPAGAGAS